MATPDFVAPYTAIAALSISGMTSIYTLATAPDAMIARYCPALLPTGVQSGADEFSSMGTAGGSFYQVRFTIGYMFLYAEAGQERAAGTLLSAAETQLGLTIAAIRAIDTTAAVRLTFSSRGPMAAMQDYSGRNFIGCPLSFDVWQF